MKRGTKSVLFGVHQFLIHPVVVFMAWVSLYGFPFDPRIWFCIFVHDLGYIGKSEMDSAEGERHVEWGAWAAGALFGRKYYELCLCHSRHYAKKNGLSVSPLCFADKLSISYMPEWLYLTCAKLSGELKEYRRISHDTGFCTLDMSDHEWFLWIVGRMTKVAKAQDASVVSYMNESCRQRVVCPQCGRRA